MVAPPPQLPCMGPVIEQAPTPATAQLPVVMLQLQPVTKFLSRLVVWRAACEAMRRRSFLPPLIFEDKAVLKAAVIITQPMSIATTTSMRV